MQSAPQGGREALVAAYADPPLPAHPPPGVNVMSHAFPVAFWNCHTLIAMNRFSNSAMLTVLPLESRKKTGRTHTAHSSTRARSISLNLPWKSFVQF